MPELPEVETVRQDVSDRYAGHELLEVTVTGRRTVRRHPPAVLAGLAGQRLAGAGRHGKYLLLEWEDGRVLVVHLRMSGQLLAAGDGDTPPLHTHAVLTFRHAGALRFVDPRTFGELFVAGPAPGPGPGGAQPRPAELGHLGPTPGTSMLPSWGRRWPGGAARSKASWSTSAPSPAWAISTPTKSASRRVCARTAWRVP